MLTKSELQAIGTMARKNNLLVITDEIYSELVYGDAQFISFLDACPDLADQTVCIQGVSKSSAMTGWRIGFAAAPPEIAKSMGAFMSQTTSNPSSIAQWAALSALQDPRSFMEGWIQSFSRRRDLLLRGLRAVDGIECRTPEGAFYAFPDIRGLMAKKGFSNDMEFADHLLREALVAVVPGSPFFAPGHIRLSYATSDEALSEATRRIAEWAKA
jgi:aspartate aminotransferase